MGVYPVIHCHHLNYSVSRWAAERTRAETWPADTATESSCTFYNLLAHLWWGLCTLYLLAYLGGVRVPCIYLLAYLWWGLCTLYLLAYLWWGLCTLYLLAYLWWGLCTLYLLAYFWWGLCTLYLLAYFWWSLCTLYLLACQVSYYLHTSGGVYVHCIYSHATSGGVYVHCIYSHAR